MFAAYRDGFTDAAWKPLTVGTGTGNPVEFTAQGPYTVTLVCVLDGGNTILTWQASHTVDDDTTKAMPEPTFQSPCHAPPAATVAVTGTLALPGTVHLNDKEVIESGAGQPFTLNVVNGTYDLIASTTDPAVKKALVQRNLTVNGATVIPTPVDAATGTALVALGLSLDNPPDPLDNTTDPPSNTETVTAEVQLQTKNNATPARVWIADYDLTNKTATTLGLPTVSLTATDTQQGKFTGIDVGTPHITTLRSITKPFTVGDDVATGTTGFDLPTLISIPAWSVDMTQRLSVALPALPALDTLTISTSGKAVNDATATKTAIYQMDITSNYFDATSLAHPVFDTGITGFMDTWKIDFSKSYVRSIDSEHDVFAKDVFTGHESSSFMETVTQ